MTVKWLKTITVVGLLGLWLAAINHCRLEQIPILSFLSCNGEASQDDDCQTDGCAQVENGLYKTENNHIRVSTPAFTLVNFLALSAESLVCDQTSPSRDLEFAPPEIPVGWQFSFRAAAPPRAPSILS